MRVVITGGAGFIGQKLAKRLLDQGTLMGPSGTQETIEELVLFDQIAATGFDDPRLKSVVGDIADAEQVAAVIGERTDSIYHLAAVVSAINTLINFLGWVAVSAAARPGDSAIYQAQARSRMVSLVASLIVQITLTIAVLVKDPVISLWLDGLGASFVSCFMISIGLRMIADCAPHLLDHSAPQEVKQRIAGTLHSEMVPPEGLLRTRTRQAGRHPQAELTLDLTGCTSLAVLNRRVDVIQRQLNSCIRDVEVSIVVDEPPGVRS